MCGEGSSGSGPMADGIRKRHSKSCASRKGRRCNCNGGWEASICLAREDKRITKTFPQKDEAKSWRTDALRAAEAGLCGRPLLMPALSPKLSGRTSRA